jgi:hypothetical protein
MKIWLEALLSLLVVTGVVGTLYNLVAPDGWISDAFHRSTPAGLASIGVIGVLGTFAWMSRGWLIRGRNAQLFVYAFAMVGLVYATRFWIHGTI